ncbi:MAG: hypothetical protein COA46_06030 [Porticoccaceae bacterium]|nr:MAG: hypothetical protein COA46_06030 [Porticoccaceae bacterium]
MVNFELLKAYAFFSDSSYVDLTSVNLLSTDDVVNRIHDEERIPGKLAETIIGSESDQWQVAHYYGVENETTGFAATVFRSGNQLVLAARGSEIGSQIDEDWIDTNFGGILLFGVAVDQAVSLFNYIQKKRGRIYF